MVIGMPSRTRHHDRRGHRPDRFQEALAWLESSGPVPRRICDLGCGTGLLLGMLGQRFPDAELVGIDLDEAAVREAAHRGRCRVVVASIFDEGLGERLGGVFDLVVLGAVLHHVTGPTRRASRARAVEALRRGFGLLGPGGVLVVVEPTFAPRWAMTALFWVKRALAPTGRRVELGRWNNLGAPLVSYYDPTELARMVHAAGGGPVFETHRRGRVRRLPRLVGVTDRWESTIAARPGSRHPVFRD